MIVKGEKHSLSETVNHDNCGQDPAEEEHRQEKEGGGGGAKCPQCWPAVVEECDLWRKVAMGTSSGVRGKTKECWRITFSIV